MLDSELSEDARVERLVSGVDSLRRRCGPVNNISIVHDVMLDYCSTYFRDQTRRQSRLVAQTADYRLRGLALTWYFA